MFEKRHQPLLPLSRFAVRMLGFAVAAMAVDGLALALGAIGYRVLEGLGWLDSALSAAMVMTGNGPLYEIRTPGAKVFTIFDARLGGVAFVVVAGVLLTPIFHRLLHAFHLKLPDETGGSP
jgi:hypothetical protein